MMDVEEFKRRFSFCFGAGLAERTQQLLSGFRAENRRFLASPALRLEALARDSQVLRLIEQGRLDEVSALTDELRRREVASDLEASLGQARAIAAGDDIAASAQASEDFDRRMAAIRSAGVLTDRPPELVGVLGKGNFGRVFSLKHDDPDVPPMVLKTIDDEENRALELEAYRLVGAHPNIAGCYGEGKARDPDTPDYMAEGLLLERVVGKNMAHTVQGISSCPGIPDASRVEAGQFLLRGVLRGLAHLEGLNLAHIDVKPENIMVDGFTGDARLIDLGSVTEADGQDVDQGFTQGYRVPDRSGRVDATAPIDKSTDSYAVGIMAWNIFANQGQPLTAEQIAGLDQRFLDPAAASFPTPSGPNQAAGGGAATPSSPERERALDFVHWLTTPVDGRRPTAAEALAHPFFADSQIDESRARQVVLQAMGS